MLLDWYQGTEFFTIIIVYRINTLNEQMQQNFKYVLVWYAVTYQDFAALANFLQSVGCKDMMLIESIVFQPLFIYYKKSLFEASEIYLQSIGIDASSFLYFQRNEVQSILTNIQMHLFFVIVKPSEEILNTATVVIPSDYTFSLRIVIYVFKFAI